MPGLVHYIAIRAKFANLGGITGPYMPTEKPSKILPLVHFTYLVTMIVSLGVAETFDWFWTLLCAPPLLVGALLVFTLNVPERFYMRTAVKPILSPRWAIFQRLLFFTLLFTTLAWLEYWTGRPWGMYYLLLWIVPLITVFSFFMMLREEIQHSNTEQAKYRDTRNFQGNPLIKWSLFPLNMDYHLPHHVFPLVPHYNLPQLDSLLRETKVYRDNATVVDGYLFAHAHDEKRVRVCVGSDVMNDGGIMSPGCFRGVQAISENSAWAIALAHLLSHPLVRHRHRQSGSPPHSVSDRNP